MQHQLSGAALNLTEGHLVEQSNWILIQLPPAGGIEVAKQVDTVVIPAPPHVLCQGPQALLCGCDKAVKRTSLADNRRNLLGQLRQHADFVIAEDPWLLGLHHQDALQNAAIDERHSKKRVVLFFAGFLEEFVAGVAAGVVDGNGTNLFGNKPCQSFMQRHAECADTALMKPKRSSQNEVRPIRLKQIGRADVGVETRGDQCHYVHQRICWLASILCEARDFV